MKTPTAYKIGRSAAFNGESKGSCLYGRSDMVLRHWWLAGWHDWHIERKTGILS